MKWPLFLRYFRDTKSEDETKSQLSSPLPAANSEGYLHCEASATSRATEERHTCSLFPAQTWHFPAVVNLLDSVDYSDSIPKGTTSTNELVSWESHSSNFIEAPSEANIYKGNAGVKESSTDTLLHRGTTTQQVEVLKLNTPYRYYSKCEFHPVSEGSSSPSYTQTTQNKASGVASSNEVPVMRIAGYFPKATPTEVASHLTDIVLRRRWDKNYLAFDLLADTMDSAAITDHNNHPQHSGKGQGIPPCSSVLAQSEPLYYCDDKVLSLPKPQCAPSSLGSVSRLQAYLWDSIVSMKQGVCSTKSAFSFEANGLYCIPPPLTSMCVRSVHVQGSQGSENPTKTQSVSLLTRPGFEVVQQRWLRHCVGSVALKRFGFKPREFMYEMLLTRRDPQYINKHPTTSDSIVSTSQPKGPNHMSAFSIVYQGLPSLTSQIINDTNGCTGSSSVSHSQSWCGVACSALRSILGSHSHTLPFDTVQVAMNYQEILVLPVFCADDKERYLRYAKTCGGSISCPGPCVQSSSNVYDGSNLGSCDTSTYLPLLGTFIIMTSCNDAKQPKCLPSFVEKAISRLFITGAYTMLEEGVKSYRVERLGEGSW